MKKINIFLFGLIILFGSCTDLEVEEKDSLLIETESGEFSGVEPAAALTSSYADLRGISAENNTYALGEVTSDALLVPTRGTDWGDNGVWRTLHQHTWDATHPQILATWNYLNSNVFRLNQLLAPVSNANATQLAEGRFLRAFNMYHLLDLFGKIPFREVNEGADVNPRVLSAQEAFDFIIADLTAALADIPVIGPGNETLRASKAAVNFLFAKMYLNKHVFIGGEPQAADMTKVIEHVDAITADGFSLNSGYFEIFEEGPDSETILWTDASWGNHIWYGLHYNQPVPTNTAGGWNGFSTTAEFYALFEGSETSNEPGSGQEERRGYVPTDGSGFGIGYGFLVGQQYGPDGEPLTDRAGNPLVFTKEFPGLVGNNERTGIRIIKYHPQFGAFTPYYILFRYADAYLMKIEAILRGGTSADDALTLYNELRTIRDASTVSSIELADILDERGRELYIEGWRRNDQIRFGTYTSTWDMKENTEEFRVLFPIPSRAITSNPNLEQNPGY